MVKKTINGITIITSSICNLKCSYCFLHKNESFKIFNSEVQKAWETGTYLINIEKSLNKLNINYNDISSIQLWGGEPLLNLKNFLPQVSLIYKIFPNISQWITSSNLNININDLIQLIQIIDKQAQQKTIFHLQLSIDGLDDIYAQKGHNVKKQIYINNLNQLCDFINNTKLQNTFIELYINATLDEQIYLKDFQDYDKLKQYMINMYDFHKFISKKCISSHLKMINEISFPGTSIPSSATTKDGQAYLLINELWDQILQNEKEFEDLQNFRPRFYCGLGGCFYNRNLFINNHECSEQKSTLTFLPDGTSVTCGSDFMLDRPLYQEELKNENNISLLKRANLSTINAINFGISSIKEIEKHDWFVYSGYRNNFSTYMTLSMGMCEELAKSNQISSEYKYNKELLFKHLAMISPYINCSRDNLTVSQIPYLSNTSTYKKFLNGLTNYIYINENKKYRAKIGDI